MLDQALLVGAGTVVGTILTYVGNWLLNYKKVSADTDKNANEQALSMYKGLVETLQKNVNEMFNDLEEREAKFLEAKVTNAALEERVKNQQEKIEWLKERIKQLEGK